MIIHNRVTIETGYDELKDKMYDEIVDTWKSLRLKDAEQVHSIIYHFKNDKQIYELIGELFILLGDKQR